MVSTFNECQLQFIFQTFEKDFQFSVCKVVQLYNILYSTLSIRINSVSTCIITIANLRKLTTLKEEVVVRKVFDLDSQGFLFRMYDVEDIANRLLAIYDTIRIGLC